MSRTGTSQVDTVWPRLVQRLRLTLNLNQTALAARLGVGQATVSRWERGLVVPELRMQFRLRDMLHRQELSITPEHIEALPIIAAIVDLRDLGSIKAASQSVATAYGYHAKDIRDVYVRPLWTRSIAGAWECVHDHHAVKSRSFALLRMTVLRPDNIWVDSMVVPIPGSDLVFTTGAYIDPPADISVPDEFKLEVVTKDELIDN